MKHKENKKKKLHVMFIADQQKKVMKMGVGGVYPDLSGSATNKNHFFYVCLP